MPSKKPIDDGPDFGEPEISEPDYLVRIVTCRRVQDGPDTSAPVHESTDIRSEQLWKLLRTKGAYVIAAHVA